MPSKQEWREALRLLGVTQDEVQEDATPSKEELREAVRLLGFIQREVFDYRALRLLMGLIAVVLPIVVSALSSTVLSSISASYYTEARDVFVGMLFAVGVLSWAYNGHSMREKWASKVASLAAILIALFPTSCDLCNPDIASIIHYAAAVILFGTLAYFCFGPFRKNTKGKGGKKGRRSKIYFACGCIMIGCMVGLIAAKLALSDEAENALSITYWAETIALVTFGAAWIVAGKYVHFKPLVDKGEALQLFK